MKWFKKRKTDKSYDYLKNPVWLSKAKQSGMFVDITSASLDCADLKKADLGSIDLRSIK